ncbi:MAG TPA: TetR/AcrR family transcriptional regulator [Acidimicrobiales bacterium]|jgi:AcrR family transcriptional regulator|nr:TetR/AcrR family transcriptional regulator [Acidimicrobiales bacterium]
MAQADPVPDDRLPADGRLARGHRTRVKVAEALIGLLEEGDPQPTAKEVADRAGISVRLVFHHFEDMDSLYRSVIELQAARHWSSMKEVPTDLPLAERIERTVRQRARLFDAIGAVRRAVTPQALRSEALSTMVAQSNVFLRDLAANTFAGELAAAGEDRRQLLDAVDLATSWEAWERLRAGQGLSATAARRVIVRVLVGLLGGGANPPGGAESGDGRP